MLLVREGGSIPNSFARMGFLKVKERDGGGGRDGRREGKLCFYRQR